MMFTRYAYASEFADSREVLEVACGTGQGLGLLARRARSVVGGDYSHTLAARANSHYRDRIPVLRFDAQALPFASASFDVVICFEAIYYFPQPEKFVAEARRLLRAGGTLIVCSANCEWNGFNRSPHSYTYFSAPELQRLLSGSGFETTLLGAFPVSSDGVGTRLTSALRTTAARLHVFPRTMKGKEFLKRLFYGPLESAPQELQFNTAQQEPLVPLSVEAAVTDFKVIFATGRKI